MRDHAAPAYSARLRPSTPITPRALLLPFVAAMVLALLWGALRWQAREGVGDAGGSAADREWHIASADAHLAVWESRAVASQAQTVTLHRRELRQVRVLLACPAQDQGSSSGGSLMQR